MPCSFCNYLFAISFKTFIESFNNSKFLLAKISKAFKLLASTVLKFGKFLADSLILLSLVGMTKSIFPDFQSVAFDKFLYIEATSLVLILSKFNPSKTAIW